MAHYDAFISYSHAKDKPVAAALQSAIQKLGKPWYRRRALRVFRDDTSLSATPHLWSTIEQALAQSRFLILLASPEAAASQWVDREIAFWLEAKRVDTLLVAVTDGTLAWDNTANDFTWTAQTPLPPLLKGHFAAEPKWVDLAVYRGGADKREAKFTELAADFAAAIRGIPKEDLLSQEVRQQRHALTLASSAAASLLVLAIAAIGAGVLAYRKQQEAIAQRDRAEATLAAATKTANRLVFDLAQRFRYTTGIPVSLIKDILDRARALQDDLINSGQTTPDIQYSEATALFQTALSLWSIGDTNGALSVAQRARQMFFRLASEHSNYETDWTIALSLGQSQILIGDIQNDQRDSVNAMEAYRVAVDLFEKLAIFDPKRPDWQHHLAKAYSKVGDMQKDHLDFANALKSYRDALAISDRLAKSDPDNVLWQYELATSYSAIGLVQEVEGDLAGALGSYRNSVAIVDKLAETNASVFNAVWQAERGRLYQSIGDVQLAQGNLHDALESYKNGQAMIGHLTSSDPGNAAWQRQLALVDEKLAIVQIKLGKLDDARASFADSIAIMSPLAKMDSNNAGWHEDIAALYAQLAKVQVQQRDLAGALKSYQASIAIRERLAESNPDNTGSQHVLISLYLRVAELYPSQARVMLTRASDVAKSMQSKGVLAGSDFWIPEDIARRIAALPK
jgi:tetratricopeptide (TPR) repeat protein